MRTTNIRFTGLASGLDTESMVQALTMPYKMKVDNAKQEQQLLDLKKDAWKEMNKKIWDFHTKTLNDLRLESTFKKTSISISNTTAIEIDKNITLPEGNHSIDIKEVASGAMVNSTSIKDKLDTVKGKDTALVDLNGSGVGIENGTVITVDTGDGSPVKITVKDVEYEEDGVKKTRPMTVADLEEQLSTKLDKKGFNCNFDEGVGAFIINSKSTGEKQTISFSAATSGNEDITADVMGKLGITANKSGKFEYKGQDAKVVYNGGIEINSSTNQVEVNGIKFTIKEKTTTPITISSTEDPDAIVDFAKKFVDEYNKLIEEMDKLVSAPKNRDYLPLTAEQKEGMTDEEIKLWNEKVQGSLLSGDPHMKDMLSSMRSILGGVVEGNTFSTLSEIGISTSSNWREKGKLYLDEDKLRKAIEKDKDAVVSLIAGEGDQSKVYEADRVAGKLGDTAKAWGDLSLEEKKTWQETNQNRYLGLGDRLYNVMNERSKSTTLKSAATFYNDKVLDNQIKKNKSEISALEERQARMESLYYERFTAMEKMLSQLNNQSSWLASQVGGM